jgi:hypothetical protein
MQIQRRTDMGAGRRGGSAVAVLAATAVVLLVLVSRAGPALDADVAWWAAQVRAVLMPAPPAPTQWTRRALWTTHSWQVTSVRVWSTP